MSKIFYENRRITDEGRAIVAQANQICALYARQGLTPILRQIYYQFIARDLFPESWTDDAGTKNNLKNYKRLCKLLSDGRVSGLIDWDHIEDRTREAKGGDFGFRNPEHRVSTVPSGYGITRWNGQDHRVECLPPDQVIITSEGTKPVIKIETGDLVLTGKGRFRPVTKILAHEYDGPMMTIRAAGLLPFQVTANHPVWTAHYDSTRPGYKGATRKFGSWEFSRADSLRSFDLLAVPKISETHPVGPVTMRTDGGRARVITVPWDASLQAVIGLYLAEGYIRKNGRTVQFTIGTHEPEHWSALTRWAESAGISTGTAVDGGARQVYLHSTSLATWLRGNFDCGARNKRIPAWLLEAPGTEQMEVMRWYYRGDGTVDPGAANNLVASTRSLDLAHQVALILIRNGYLPSVHNTSDHGEPQYRIAVSGQSGTDLMRHWGHEPQPMTRRFNHLRHGDGHMHAPVRKITTEHYSGLVYNLEVEEDHTYCAPAVIHNCWVEKESLAAIVARPCNRWNVTSLACKGSPSMSMVHDAADRLIRYERRGLAVIVYYMGNHDPTGLDIDRDIQTRLALMGCQAEVRRIALTMNQIDDLQPPPSPVKLTDSRTSKYVDLYGTEQCWELDALDPDTLDGLIEEAITSGLDMSLWRARERQEERDLVELQALADNWTAVRDFLDTEGYLDYDAADQADADADDEERDI